MAIRRISPLLLLLLLVSLLSPALGEEMRYTLDDFAVYLEWQPKMTFADEFLTTVTLEVFEEGRFPEAALLERFPALAAREGTSGERYLTCPLADGSALFLFIDNGSLTSVCRMLPRCTVEAFASIAEGASPEVVAAVDPNTTASPFLGWGPATYHCLADGTFRQIRYRQTDSSKGFVVDEITTIPQEDCLCILRALRTADMP